LRSSSPTLYLRICYSLLPPRTISPLFPYTTLFRSAASDVNDGDLYDPQKDVYENHMHSIHGSRNAVMLIRLRHQDAQKAIEREGQEDFHYGDYSAYSKICTHIGCPTSLYEAQTNRILCPCHQSQFDALHYAKPLFGPAARALPQRPIIARIPAAVLRSLAHPLFMSLRPTESCVHATSRSSPHCTTLSQSSDQLRVHWHSGRSPWMERATSWRRATSSCQLARHSGS